MQSRLGVWAKGGFDINFDQTATPTFFRNHIDYRIKISIADSSVFARNVFIIDEPFGKDRSKFSLISPGDDLGTRPTGEIIKSFMGIEKKGPATLPRATSFISISSTRSMLHFADL